VLFFLAPWTSALRCYHCQFYVPTSWVYVTFVNSCLKLAN
jgi:hypothetical protein